jgi:hypothetical protein
VVAVYSVVRQATVVAPAIAEHRARPAVATMVSVVWGTFVVNPNYVVYPVPHVVALLLDVVRRRTLSVVMEVVVRRTKLVAPMENVVPLIPRFVAPTMISA